MRKVFAAWRPETVYHAAAYKHVPLVEQNAVEGVRNNLVGTMTTAEMPSRLVSDRTGSGLRRYNAAMGLLHAVQAVAVIALANNFTLPVNGTFLEGPPGSPMLDPVRPQVSSS